MTDDHEEWLLSDEPSPALQELRAAVEDYLAANRAYLEAQRRSINDQLAGTANLIALLV